MDANQNGGSSAPTTTHAYTCNTCQVAYRNGELQKGHMKSDWHRYNLKRKVASLPPISAEVFTEKVLQARAATAAEADKALFERACEVCQRTYNSENAYNNHMSSLRHRQRVFLAAHRKDSVDDAASSVISSTFSLGEPLSTDKQSVDSDAEEEFHEVVEGLKKTNLDDITAPSPVKRPSNPHPSAQANHADESMSEDQEDRSTTPVPSKSDPTWTPTACIFCNYNSPTLPLNAHHMERFHGMFIPEKKYLVSLEGLLQHLQKRVFENHQCIACGKVRSNTFAVQTHMRDKSHCTIPYTSLEEQLDIGEFYDFRSTYSDEEDDSEGEDAEKGETNGGAKLAFKPKYAKLQFGGSTSESDEEEGWETDSDDESMASEEITAVYTDDTKYERLDKHTHHSKNDPRHHHQVDGWHSHAHKHAHAVFYDDYALHLPSGKSVGHRSLNVYFRQNLHSHPSAAERAERLAIEAEANRAAMSADRMEVDEDESAAAAAAETDDRQLTVIANVSAKAGREVSKRNALGMTGLPEKAIRSVQRQEARGRAVQQRRERASHWKKEKGANKTENYSWHVGLGVVD